MVEEEKPREKLMHSGAEALSDAELLAVILKSGVKGMPVMEMAKQILQRFNGNLLGVCDATVNELCEIPGMGQAKSLELCAAFALVKRLAQRRLAERPDTRSPIKIAQYMQAIFNGSRQEEFHVLLLDTQLRLIRNERVSMGLVDRSLVHAREVFRCAIREACTSIILCHNHPSGNLKPSKCDIDITKSLVEAGNIIGIKVVDHIIVGSIPQNNGMAYFSFMENGIMPKSSC